MLFQRLFRPDKSLTLRGKCYIWNSWQKREDLELKIGKNHKKKALPSQNQHESSYMLCATMENADSSSSHSCTTDNDVFKT